MPRPFVSRDDYTPDELAWLQAIDHFKREQQKPCPTWKELFRLALAMGYRRDDEDRPEDEQAEAFTAAMRRYMRRERRLFPTACQVLDVLTGLGYRQ